MLKQSSSGMKKVLTILLAIFFVLSLTAVAASAQGGEGSGEGGGYGPGGIYHTPYYAGNPNSAYANPTEHAHGHVYT